jgi:hypothetical protein
MGGKYRSVYAFGGKPAHTFNHELATSALEDRRVKLATWNCTAVGIAILLMSGSLHAQTPESLPAPARAGAKSWRQSGPAGPEVNTWSDYGNETKFASSDAGYEGQIVMEGAEFVDHSAMHEDGPAYPYSSGYWWRNGCWYAASDFVVWHRTRPFGQVLGFDASFPIQDLINAPPQLNKNGSSMGVEPGNRTTLGYMLMRDIDNRDHSIEATYLGFNPWSTQDGLESDLPRQLFTQLDFAAPGFNAADFYSTYYESQFHSLELNYRIRNRPGRDRMIMGPDGFWSRQIVPGRTQSLILGLRGLTIDEEWQWLSGRNGVSAETFSGNMDITTDNNLLGVQIGGDCLDVHEGWYWGVRGSAGVYCNFAEGSYQLDGRDTQSDSVFIDNRAHNQSSAFMGELSFMFGIELTDRITLRTSYDLALVGGLAIAPDQVSFDTYLADRTPALNEGGQIFYNGLSVGLEAYW